MKLDGIFLETNEHVYPPDEDSFTLAKALDRWFKENEPQESLKILEVGCGTGFLVIRLAKTHPQHLYCATDINWHACSITKRNAVANGVLVHVSCQHLSNGFRSSTHWGGFDLVFFNPPYLPSDDNEPRELLDIATLGGKQGIQVMFDFIHHVPRILSPRGQVLLLTTHWNPRETIIALARRHFDFVIPYFKRKSLSERHTVFLLKNDIEKDTTF